MLQCISDIMIDCVSKNLMWLCSIRPEDVGYDKGVTVNGSKVVKQESKENDPLVSLIVLIHAF